MAYKMEKLIYIVLFSISTIFIMLLIKKSAPEYSVIASICVSCMIIFLVAGDINEIVKSIMNLASETDSTGQWANSVMKVTVISFIGQWGCSICRDSGENSIAEKLETAVKIMILIICLPYINMLFTVAKEIN